MIRNPNRIDDMGKPYCYGNYDLSEEECAKCYFMDNCQDEELCEKERNPDKLDNEGKPECFGFYHSDYSIKCSNCDWTIGCARELKENAEVVRHPQIDAVKYKEDGKTHLNVLDDIRNLNPKTYKTNTPTKPPVVNGPNFNYSSTGYTSNYSSYSSSNYGNSTVYKKPSMTDEQAEYWYGQKLHKNPLVEGQFENESWYARLAKEFLLKTADHGVKVLAHLFSDMISRIRWAPKQ